LASLNGERPIGGRGAVWSLVHVEKKKKKMTSFSPQKDLRTFKLALAELFSAAGLMEMHRKLLHQQSENSEKRRGFQNAGHVKITSYWAVNKI